MLHPRVGVWVLAFKVIPLRITAGLALGIWIALQVVMVAMPDMGPVAWWAHIGGLIAGAVLILFMRRPGVPLFDKGLRLAQG
jgi:membrane associated rhomboid family serine protease